MILTAEISKYPFKEDYIPPIQDYIDSLQACDGIKVQSGPTSTIICGEMDRVMAVLQKTMLESYNRYGKSVYVTKLIPGLEAL